MSPLFDEWRCFRNVASDAEAAAFSENCLFSLATLEIDCDPATHRFALTEQEQPGAWRWAIVNDRGAILQSGREPTQEKAKTIAALALHQDATGSAVNLTRP
jgi:hypothetical protein